MPCFLIIVLGPNLHLVDDIFQNMLMKLIKTLSFVGDGDVLFLSPLCRSSSSFPSSSKSVLPSICSLPCLSLAGLFCGIKVCSIIRLDCVLCLYNQDMVCPNGNSVDYCSRLHVIGAFLFDGYRLLCLSFIACSTQLVLKIQEGLDIFCHWLIY